MMQHLYLKYPPFCESCGKTPPAKVGIWHINEGDLGFYLCDKCKESFYPSNICKECHDEEVADVKINSADTVEE
jgi:hypothetical protein